MPILAGGLAAAPPDGAVVVDQPVWSQDLGTITATWIDPDAVEWPLSNPDLGWFTANGPAGWGSAPLELVVDPLPRGGEQVRYIRSKPRRLQWPLYIGGDTHQEFIDRLRRLTRAFAMTTQRGAPGWLRVQRPDGRDTRQIACYYEEGFEGQSGEGHLYARPVVGLYCPDGFWSGVAPVVAEREFDTGAEDPDEIVSFYQPFMSVTSSRVVSGDDGTVPSTIITNDGDIEAWPVWTISGPISSLTAVNLSIGARFTLAYPLPAGQSLTISTNRPAVRGPAGQNLSRHVDWLNPLGTELWPLVDGPNQVSFVALGAGPGTKVALAFTPRFDTA